MEANGKSENVLGWQLEMAGYRRWSQHKSYKKNCMESVNYLFLYSNWKYTVDDDDDTYL